MSMPGPSERPATGFARRMSLGYAGVFAPLAVQLAFVPLWFEHVGFSPEAIGLLLGVPLLVRTLTTPPLAALADRVDDRARLYVAVALAALLLSVGYLVGTGFAWVLAISIGIAIAMAMAVPLSDAIALSGVRRYAVSYGPIRLWGSVAFIGATFAAGWLVDWRGAAVVPLVLTACLAATVATGMRLPRVAIDRMPSSAPPLRDPALLCAFAASALVVGSQATYYGFSSIHWSRLGFSANAIALLWSLGVVAEIVLFAVADRLLGRPRPVLLIAAGAIVGAVRWATFTWEGGIGFYALNSLMHAGSFAAAHLGLQQLIAQRVDDRRQGAAQGVAYAFSGPTMALATLAAGWLYAAHAVHAFWAAAAMCVAALPLLALAVRSDRAAQPQRSREGGETIEPE